MSQTHPSAGERRFGYFVTILINFAMIYVAANLLNWNVPFLTERFNECLWAINLSLYAIIFINFIFMAFDRKWFRNLMEAFSSVFSFISVYVFRNVFPLDISAEAARWVNFGLIIILVLVAIAILAGIMRAIRNYRRDSEK